MMNNFIVILKLIGFKLNSYFKLCESIYSINTLYHLSIRNINSDIILLTCNFVLINSVLYNLIIILFLTGSQVTCFLSF